MRPVLFDIPTGLQITERFVVDRVPPLEELSFATTLGEVSFAVDLDADRRRDEVVYTLGRLFRKHGWNGRGEIRVIWVPPFLLSEGGAKMGTLLYYVEHDATGNGLIASHGGLEGAGAPKLS